MNDESLDPTSLHSMNIFCKSGIFRRGGERHHAWHTIIDMRESSLENCHFSATLSTLHAYRAVVTLFGFINGLNRLDLQDGSAWGNILGIDHVRGRAEWTK